MVFAAFVPDDRLHAIAHVALTAAGRTMIEARRLTKRYGGAIAVDDLSFRVLPGRVTGFLGPNGAGKSTTMRMIMGLDRPSGGSVTVNGRPFDRHRWPLREVGALLEAKAMHPSRRAADHLRWLAASNGLPHSRVDEVLAAVGLSSAALKKPKGYSLGMAQRLGIAAALIGDPGVLLFDEPVNGLDPEGILWIRNLLRSLAAEGRTIFVSSHLMSEMALTADHVIVIGRGRLVADTSMAELVARSSSGRVRLVSPDAAPFAERLAVAGAHVMREGDGSLTVTGLDARAIGELGRDEGLLIYELTPQQASLEEAFMQLTHDSVDYAADEALLTHAGANR